MLPLIPMLCWLALWASINTGPWYIDLDKMGSGGIAALNGIRAALPLVVLAVWIFHLIGRGIRMREPTLPEWLWFFYAVVCLVASVGLKDWFTWGYWGLAFIATLGTVEMYIAECGGELAGAESLNRLGWVAAAVILGLIVYTAGGQLVAETAQGLSGYGMINRIREVGGMPTVRSSGISRFAAAVAIVACAAMWRGERRWARVLWLALFGACAWVVWVMQSRGSLASFVAGLGVMMIVLGGRARTIGILTLVVAGGAIGLNFVSHHTIHQLWLHATRNQHQLATMTGRTRIFHYAWEEILRSPIIGYGPQADHQFLREIGNAQNGVLYALLCGGFVGGGAWIIGFAVALGYLARAAWRPDIVRPRDSMVFAQVAGLMVFFTLRTIPENTAALFSVDLMLQLPAMVYLGALIRAAKLRNARRESAVVARHRAGARAAMGAADRRYGAPGERRGEASQR
jgi:O-antigen ligase